MIQTLLDRFTKETPVAVMVRAMLANVWSDENIDRIFRDTAVRQRQDHLLFSTVVNLLHLAVFKIKPSLHSAYISRREELDVTITAVYDKIAGAELAVSRQLVKQTSASMRQIHDALGTPHRVVLPGYEVRVLDGSHLRATERRLDVHRMINGAPLPGQALVVLDPQRRLIEDMYPDECGHAQERLILHELIDELQAGVVWFADRNFCTSVFLQEIALAKSWFVIRRHASFSYTEVGERTRVGRTPTGTVYEQAVVHEDSHGGKLSLRKIVIELDKPTSDGDTMIELLTNLPADVSALAIADSYRSRWAIEGVFGELTLSLNGEINTLAYPPAAIIAYALALISFNVLTLVRASVEVVQGQETADSMSTYHMAEEVSSTDQGMTIAIPVSDWRTRFGSLKPVEMAEELKRMAREVQLRRYRKSPRGPKKPKTKRTGSYQHVSTQKLLSQQKR